MYPRAEEMPWFVREVFDAVASDGSHDAGTAISTIADGYEVMPATTVAKLAWLTDIDLFQKMPLSTLAELARDGELRRYPQGEILCKEGQRSDGMFLLLSGEADVFLNRDGGVQRVSAVTAGQTIGEMGVFTKKPRAATVVIGSSSADVLAFGEEQLDTVWENPHASRGVLLRVFEYYQQARRAEHESREASPVANDEAPAEGRSAS